MAGAKQEELLQSHPVKEQLPGVDNCINSPPSWPEAVLLGFQHYLVMLGTTVLIPSTLVPQMGGNNRFLQTMRGIQGALIAALSMQIIIGFSGIWRIVLRFLSPLSAVPIVTLAGLGLYQLGFPGVAKCIEIELPQIVLLILFSHFVPQWLEGRRALFDRFAVIFSTAIVWVYALILTVGGACKSKSPTTQYNCRTDHAGLIGAAPWIRIPYPFQWGGPTLNAGESFAMMAAHLLLS